MILLILSYLDPGTGSLIIQITIAAITGVIFFLVSAKQKLREIVKQFFNKKKDTQE